MTAAARDQANGAAPARSLARATAIGKLYIAPNTRLDRNPKTGWATAEIDSALLIAELKEPLRCADGAKLGSGRLLTTATITPLPGASLGHR